jgi:hypothetical protein
MIKSKDDEELLMGEIDSTIRAAANLHFTQLKNRWLYTHGSALQRRLYAQHVVGEIEVTTAYVLGEIDEVDDGE